jgi:4,5-DOPA dioxygenase extradiol
MSRLPTLFISHGSPMHAIEEGAVADAWVNLAKSLPRPKAILMASAHWETELPAMTGSEHPETIHDFGGFPQELYRIQYPAPGLPSLAERARALLKEQGQCSAIDGTRGLDHGAWSPILHMYPEADIPVVQVAMQTALGPAHHLAMGRALAPLADEGVLVIGSGNMTHNLHEAFSAMRNPAAAKPLPYVAEFSEWVKSRIEAHDLDALVDYRRQAPHAARAHPSEEHFLPLHVAIGAAVGQSAAEKMMAERVYSDIELSSLSMDVWAFH